MRRYERLTALVGASVAIGLGLPGCGSESKPKKIVNHEQEAATACTPDKTLKLPKGFNIKETTDNRTGYIYPCQYLNDMEIPTDTPLTLKSVSSSIYTDTESRVEGKTDSTIFGPGRITGYVEGSGSSTAKQAEVAKFLTPDGFLKTLILDNADVKVKLCEDECDASITILAENKPLWKKDSDDNSSIWMYTHDFGFSCFYDKDGEDYKRQKTLARVSIRGSDATCKPAAGEFKVVPQFTGGPKSVGEVVGTLSSSIVLTVPDSHAANTGANQQPR